MDNFFIAIPLPDFIKSQLSRICVGIPNAQWVEQENFIISLRHLGKITEMDSWDIKESLAQINHESFTLSLKEVGYFHSKSSGTVWIGVEQSPCLIHLKKSIDSLLRKFKLEAEDRLFTPHVVLAKYEKVAPHKLIPFLEANLGFSTLPFKVDSFSLMTSRATLKRIIFTEEDRYILT